MQLRLASFGLRGFIGESFTPKVMMDFASAYATFTDGGTIFIARDTRDSSPMMATAVTTGLLAAGCNVVDFGICPTPILQHRIAASALPIAGAVSISGGHTGMGWNAISLIGPDGAFLPPSSGGNVLDFYHGGDFLRATWESIGSLQTSAEYARSLSSSDNEQPEPSLSTPYFDALENLVDTEAIRKQDFTVVIDPVGGSGCGFIAEFAERLGFRLIPVNAEPSGYLPREPEPRPRSALPIASMIQHVGGDVGFVLSSDMGRLSLVSETGEPFSEECTLPILVDHFTTAQKGVVVTNTCTTRTIDDIAAARNCRVVKTPVGQASIVAALCDEDGLIGGEGNGSACIPTFSRGFDGFAMMAIVLEAMALNATDGLDALVHRLPLYHISKRRVYGAEGGTYQQLERLSESLYADPEGGEISHIDGIRVDWEDGWIHIRMSKTEQMIRVISEAREMETARTRRDKIIQLLNRLR